MRRGQGQLLGLMTVALSLVACGDGGPAAQARLSQQAVSCGVWNASTAYTQGDTVVAGGVTYKANFWTQNNPPATNNGPAGSGQPWTVTNGCTTPPPPPPPPGPSLTVGNSYSFQVTNAGLQGRYLRHLNSLGYTELVTSSSDAALKADASWKVVAGLADASCVSLQSVNFPDKYLRHAGSRARIDAPDGSDLFKADATWCVKAALDGSSANVSLQSKNYPTSYLRHRGGEVWAEAGSDALYKQDATWTAATAWSTVTPPPPPPPAGFKRVAYFAQWGIYLRNYKLFNTQNSGAAAGLTHLNYAFGGITPDGSCTVTYQGKSDSFADYTKSYPAAESVDGVGDTWDQKLRGNFNQLKKLKAKNPGLKVLISLGGWTWSKEFSDVALTDAARKKFVSSCIDIYINGNLPVTDGAGGPGAAAGVFDGIDIDWEYPASEGNTGNIVRPEDTRNFTLLLEEFRRQLGSGKLLTAALPAAPAKIAKLEVANIARSLDLMNVMTYDFRGAWAATGPTNFHANLYPDPASPGAEDKTWSIDTAINSYLGAGAPAAKLIVGLPFYGRGWTGVGSGNNGLYQGATGPATGSVEPGIEDYKVLVGRPGTVYRHPVTKQMWKFDGSTFWSYDDPQQITDKTAYIRQKGLGGGMAWALDGDDANASLAKAMYNGLK